MPDAPIEPMDFTLGVKVVQIEDLRIARGLTRRPASSCSHRRTVYDKDERRVWCQDCETEVEPFDAFLLLVEYWGSATKQIERRRRELDEAEQFQLRSRAAKVMDEAWRSRTMAPCCPHCSEAILPGDVVNGIARTSREFAEARRRRNASTGSKP